MMTKTRKISKTAVVILAVLFLFLSLIPLLSSSVPAAAQTYDGRERRGCWWWYMEDATNKTTREEYLTLLEQTGVTEIYLEAYPQLWDTFKHDVIHTFVEAAKAHGMRVSVIMDDPAMVTNSDLSMRYMIKLRDGFKAYKETYPDDNLYGIHFDVEPGGYNTAMLQKYCDNLVANARTYLIDEGIYVEFDVNPAWSGCGGVEYNGEKGFYNAVCSVIADGKGTLSLMSYRPTTEAILHRANEAGAVDAAIAHNVDFMYGVETGDSGEDGVDIHDKDKATLCTILDGLSAELRSKNYIVDAGIAIHHARAIAKLPGTLSTSTSYKDTGVTVTRPSYTHAAAQTTDVADVLEKITLCKSDELKMVSIENYIGLVNDAAIDNAIREDIAKNGVIEGDEYYEIITNAYVSGKSGYAVAGFFTGGYEFWGSDTIADCSIIGTQMDITAQRCTGKATDKHGKLLAPQMSASTTQLAFFSDANGWKDRVSIKSIEINVYRYKNGYTPAVVTTVAPATPTTTLAATPTATAAVTASADSGSEEPAKKGLTDKMIDWFRNTFSWMSKEVLVFIISMVPILECRGGVIAAKLMEVDILTEIPLCIIGNLIPVPFILWFITPIFNWLKKTKLFRGLVEKIEKKAEGKTDKLENGAFWALVLFVGIPLPGTGAWTGSLIASMLNMKFKKAFPAVIIGVIMATVIMSAVFYGLFDAIVALF